MKASATERELVLSEGERRGWPSAELDAAIAIESGWDPSAHNRIRAGGLIGFLPSLLPKLGWTSGPEAFQRLSAAEQAPYVGKYFDLIGQRWHVPGDTYLALAAPSYVGADDATVVYARGSNAWKQNPGWRGPDGEITAGSIRGVVLRKMAGYHAPLRARTGAPLLMGLALAFAWWRWGRAHGN